MAEVEIDLRILEEMCSELEEPSILFDKSLRVAWINSLSREKIGFEIKDCYTDSDKIIHKFRELYGEFIEKSFVEKVFQTGKLMKKTYHHVIDGEQKIVKIVNIPIKYGSDVLYVLGILEIQKLGSVSDDKINDVVLNNSQERSSMILHALLDIYEFPCFVVINNKFAAANRKFLDIIGHNSGLRNYIESVEDFDKEVKHLKSLFRFSFKLSSKPLRDKNKIIGRIYFIHPQSISNKVHKKRIKKHKSYKIHNKNRK